jgi:hypothetical protein
MIKQLKCLVRIEGALFNRIVRRGVKDTRASRHNRSYYPLHGELALLADLAILKVTLLVRCH